MKFLLASFKTLTDSENCSESRIKFLSDFPLLSLVNFVQCTFIASFRNNFQDHRRVTEQLLETQAVIRKPEQGILELISQLVSDFIEVSRTFNLDFLHKKTI